VNAACGRGGLCSDWQGRLQLTDGHRSIGERDVGRCSDRAPNAIRHVFADCESEQVGATQIVSRRRQWDRTVAGKAGERPTFVLFVHDNLASKDRIEMSVRLLSREIRVLGID
jgi:hypothetical protein